MVISRRRFTTTALAATSSLMVPGTAAFAFQTQEKVSTKPYPPVQVKYTLGTFERRHSDLGGVLDKTTGLIWGYEPWGGMINGGAGLYWVQNTASLYPALVLDIAQNDVDPNRRALYATTYQIISQRSWRTPTVFEARDAVAKGLFTFGDGGCNMYYNAPESTVPGVSYSVANLRWSSSQVKNGLTHIWSPGDGGTNLGGSGSSLILMVVSRL